MRKKAAILASVVTVLLAGFAGSANAALDKSYPTAHYLVQYTTTVGDKSAISDQAAIDLANTAEAARARYVDEWGFPAPAPDKDGKTDIQVTATVPTGVSGVTRPRTSGDHPVPYVQIKPSALARPAVITHEIFHTIQYAMYRPLNRSFVGEATANWATASFFPTQVPLPFALSHPEYSLDCNTGTCPNGTSLRYGQWGFFQFLSEQFGGPKIVLEIYQQAAAAANGDHKPHVVEAISGALRKHGVSFTTAFNRYAAASIPGGGWLGITFNRLKPVFAAKLTAKASRKGGGQHVQLDHLASAYIDVGIAIVKNPKRCQKAKLQIRVRMPKQAASKPTFGLFEGSTSKLKVKNGRATLNRRVDACFDSGGTLVLSNASPSLNDQQFLISARVVPSKR